MSPLARILGCTFAFSTFLALIAFALHSEAWLRVTVIFSLVYLAAFLITWLLGVRFHDS